LTELELSGSFVPNELNWNISNIPIFRRLNNVFIRRSAMMMDGIGA
jgi:hypothetical protein